MTKIDRENKDKTNKSEIVEEQKPREESTAKRRKGVSSIRLKKLEANLAEVEKERDELKDFLLRKAAEFDNFKKRTENEQIQLIANANADLITELLPVLDDLERSLNAADKNKKFEVLLAGVQLIFKKFTKI